MIIAIIAVLVISFILFFLIDFLQRAFLLSGEDWIFFEPMPYAMKFLIFPIVILLMEAFGSIVYRIAGNPSMKSAYSFMNFITKHKVPVTIICVLMIYIGFTGISSVDSDGVTRRSALNPVGRTYDLELISSVDTGFKRNGDFYYIINVDGKKLKFNAPTVNAEAYPEYVTNEYKSFSDFDEKLMALGIPKNADTSSLDNALYDESVMQYLKKVVS